MNGEEKNILAAIIGIACCFMTAAVGCTIINAPEDRAPLLKECVSYGLEWHDGYCKKPKQKGGGE